MQMRRALLVASCLLASLVLVQSGCSTSHRPATTASPAAVVDPIVCSDNARWDDPATPRRLHGDTWYVGTCGISALLITSPAGHVLIDGGTVNGGRQVLANIQALGFQPRDIRAILFSHEHHDHIGGLAGLQLATGAPAYARLPAVETLKRGASGRDDPQFQSLDPFPPVPDVRTIADTAQVKVGPLALQAIPTPGHTPGGTSWTWRSCDGGACRQLVYADSLTAISDDAYRFSDEHVHPGYVSAFRESVQRVADLPCDILVTPHPAASQLWARIGPDATEPLVNPDACRLYARTASERLDKRLADEAAAPATKATR